MTAFGITTEEALASASAAVGPCAHRRTAPVALLVTGEVVAALCEDCLERLPASWGCDDCEYIDVTRLGDATPRRVMGRPCQRHERSYA